MARSTSRHGSSGGGSAFARIGIALVVVVLLAVAFVAVQLLRSVPVATASVTLPSSTTVPAGLSGSASMPWPVAAAADVEVLGVGGLGSRKANVVVPIASVTKLVTALTVLRTHPLSVGQSGPAVPVSAAEAAAYPSEAALHESVVKVVSGENLSELQALEALLVPSGDNIARILASWSAGSQSAFVTAMNSEASSLGLRHTHLAGPSGLNAASVSTAADVMRLGADALANPLLRQIVAMPQVTLPVAGTVYNYNSAVGHNGIIGIKTGSSGAAGGDFVFAAQRHLYGRTLTVVGAVLGEGGVQPLPDAIAEGQRLASAAFTQVHEVTVLASGRQVLSVHVPWGHGVSGSTSRGVQMLAVAGERVSLRVVRSGVLLAKSVGPLHGGEQVASVVVTAGSQSQTVPVIASGPVPAVSVSYRLGRI